MLSRSLLLKGKCSSCIQTDSKRFCIWSEKVSHRELWLFICRAVTWLMYL